MSLPATLLAAALLFAIGSPAAAHPVPFSYVDLRMHEGSIELSVVAHVLDLAHDLGVEPPERLLRPEDLAGRAAAVQALIAERLVIRADGIPLRAAAWAPLEPLAERQSVRARARLELRGEPGRVQVHAVLFPYDPQHRTFLNLYEDDAVAAQAILDAGRPEFDHFTGTTQGRWAVLQKFVPAGVHHILIGPDHLLFLAGLLLLGGTMRQLLLVVSAFTIAHSITLSLAALGLMIPPAHAVEPAIALSVVYVGADNLLVRAGGGRDTRLWVAFGFGLLHGFGFASVLRDMDLPSRALGWTLFGFNLGVEIGQIAVVVLVAAVFAWVRARGPRATTYLSVGGSIVVIGLGVFWFVQRVFFSGGMA